MKIAIFTDSYYPLIDGVVRFVDKLCLSLHNQGHDITLIIPQIGKSKKSDYNTRPFEVELIPTLPVMVKSYYMCLPSNKFKSIVEKVDLIIINSLMFTTVYTLLVNHIYNKPIIQFVHVDERDLLDHSVNLPKAVESKIFDFFKFMSKQVDYYVVATNKFYQRTVTMGAEEDKIYKVTFGYDKIETSKEAINQYKQKLGIHNNNTTVLYLGRLADEKNIMTTVKTMGILSQSHRNIKLLIAGTGYKEKKIKNQIAKNNYDITMIGRVPDDELHLCYQAADILLSPSYHEALCFTVVEAMSYGVVPAINKKFEEDELHEDNSILLESIEDADYIAHKLSSIISDQETLRKLQHQALKTSKQFTWERFSDHWEENIQQIVKREIRKTKSETING